MTRITTWTDVQYFAPLTRLYIKFSHDSIIVSTSSEHIPSHSVHVQKLYFYIQYMSKTCTFIFSTYPEHVPLPSDMYFYIQYMSRTRTFTFRTCIFTFSTCPKHVQYLYFQDISRTRTFSFRTCIFTFIHV